MDYREGVHEAEWDQIVPDLVEHLVRAGWDLDGVAGRHACEVHDGGVAAVRLVHHIGRLRRQHHRTRGKHEDNLAGEDTTRLHVSLATGLGDREHCLAEWVEDDRGRLGNPDRHRRRRRHRARTHGRAGPGQLIRLVGAVLVAEGDAVDGIHHEGLGAEVRHDQVVARLHAVGDELPIAAVAGRVVARVADVGGRGGRLGRASIGLVIREAEQADPRLARRLVELAQVGRHGNHDVRRVAALLGRRRVGDAGHAGEDDGDRDGRRDEGLYETGDAGHGAVPPVGMRWWIGFLQGKYSRRRRE